VPRRHVFHQGMDSRGIEGQTPVPRGHDGRRTTARAHGKVARPCRTGQEAHETWEHFQAPQTEAAAKAGLCHSLRRYNDRPHRSASQARMEDWRQPLPPEGLRARGRWERWCALARAPDTRQGAVDARGSVAGVRDEGDPEWAGETVPVCFGLYAAQLLVEHGERRYGP
jgi:hypothetical protein